MLFSFIVHKNVAEYSILSPWFIFAGGVKDGTRTFRVFWFDMLKEKDIHDYSRDVIDDSEDENVGRQDKQNETRQDEQFDSSSKKTVSVPPAKPDMPRRSKIRTRKRKVRDKQKKSRSNFREIFFLFWNERRLIFLILKRIKNNIRKLIGTIKLERLQVLVDIATPDPALTGSLYGIASVVTNLPTPKHTNLQVDANYFRDYPELNLHFELSIRPLTVLTLSGIGLLTLPWYTIARTGWKIRKGWKQIHSVEVESD